jgi:hypothetical protein
MGVLSLWETYAKLSKYQRMPTNETQSIARGLTRRRVRQRIKLRLCPSKTRERLPPNQRQKPYRIAGKIEPAQCGPITELRSLNFKRVKCTSEPRLRASSARENLPVGQAFAPLPCDTGIIVIIDAGTHHLMRNIVIGRCCLLI